MKRIALCFALALSPLTLAGVTACASFEQVAPKTPRAALADAETAFIGAIEITSGLYNAGVIDRDATVRLAAKFVEISDALDVAHRLLKAGETLAASRSIEEIAVTLSAIALELAIARETENAAPPPAVNSLQFQPVKV